MSAQLADAAVVVALVGFYGGVARDLGTTADLVEARVGVGLSVGAYVAGGVAALLSLAIVAIEAARAAPSALDVAATAVGLSVLFVVVFGLFFRIGIAAYAVALRAGLRLS
ncbi:hypothetical protein [Halorussus marinus]|uniref:hypothetical protein n=1 Tax=Halorussus marinus TaxID=2505976 RepID=UPI001091B3FB|nr:hypothetical protein [Halorussus marinus]